MFMNRLRIPSFLDSPAFKAIDLCEDVPDMSDEGTIAIKNKLLLPVYVRLGANILNFTGLGKDAEFGVAVSKCDEEGQAVSETLFTNGIHTIGRTTSPMLELDSTASRRHLSLLVGLGSFSLQDLNSLNGSILYAQEESILSGHFTRSLEPTS